MPVLLLIFRMKLGLIYILTEYSDKNLGMILTKPRASA